MEEIRLAAFGANTLMLLERCRVDILPSMFLSSVLLSSTKQVSPRNNLTGPELHHYSPGNTLKSLSPSLEREKIMTAITIIDLTNSDNYLMTMMTFDR